MWSEWEDLRPIAAVLNRLLSVSIYVDDAEALRSFSFLLVCSGVTLMLVEVDGRSEK